MQNELKLRLIDKHPDFPNGIIMGYEWHRNGGIYHCPHLGQENNISFYYDITDTKDDDEYEANYIRHDFIEQGIEVDGDWWFDGDRFKGVSFEINSTLSYGEFQYEFRHFSFHCFGWHFKHDNGGVCQFFEQDLKQIKRIGTIHDEPKDE